MYSQRQLPDSSWNLFIDRESSLKMSERRTCISIVKVNLIEKLGYASFYNSFSYKDLGAAKSPLTEFFILQGFGFYLTSALPMGFLPDSHPHKLMMNYSMIKLSLYPVHISMLAASLPSMGSVGP